MKKPGRALRVGGSLKDRSLVVGEDFQPRTDITGVIVSRLKFRGDAEVGAEEAAAEFGDQPLSRAFGSVLGIAVEVSIEAFRRRRPVNQFMAENGGIGRCVAKRRERRHLNMIARGRIVG